MKRTGWMNSWRCAHFVTSQSKRIFLLSSAITLFQFVTFRILKNHNFDSKKFWVTKYEKNGINKWLTKDKHPKHQKQCFPWYRPGFIVVDSKDISQIIRVELKTHISDIKFENCYLAIWRIRTPVLFFKRSRIICHIFFCLRCRMSNDSSWRGGWRKLEKCKSQLTDYITTWQILRIHEHCVRLDKTWRQDKSYAKRTTACQ